MDESSVIGERVYVSIDGSSMPSTVVYAVESCTVRNEAFGLEIPVVTGKCGESLLATDFHTAGPYSAQHPAQLSYTAFHFDAGQAGQTQENTIACHLRVCEAADDAQCLSVC